TVATVPPVDYPPDSILGVLDPTNALAFWLKGYNSDPQFPVTGAGERNAFFDFDKGRITANGQYYPAGDSEKKPYLYYNSASYTRQDYTITPTPEPNNDPNGEPAVRWAIMAGVASPYASSTTRSFAEPEKFQIISAGLDGDYGETVHAEVNGQVDDFADYMTVPSGKNLYKEHRDNITSLGSGTINDLLDE
ncbi:MAG TPA: hypothetical protein VIY86_03675, partial [Pirellulaceae bacterium]